MDSEWQSVPAALSEMHILSGSSPPYYYRTVPVVIICMWRLLRLNLKYTYIAGQETDVWEMVFISTNRVKDH